MHNYGFQIADIAVTVSGPGSFRHRGPFRPTTSPSLQLAAAVASEPLRPQGAPIVECDTWAAFASPGRVSLLSKIATWSPTDVARIDLCDDSIHGRLWLRPDLAADPLQYPLDQLLMIHLLRQRGGLLLHAAAAMVNGRGIVVAGPSGEGKTTFAKQAAAVPGVRVLSDERVVLTPTDACWLVHGTPWAGEGKFADNASAPLAAIFLLDKSDRDEVYDMSPVRALARMVRCHFPATWAANHQAHEMNTLEALLTSTPCFGLRTRLGGNAVELALKAGGADASH